jgi:L-methionine (R)-S-oxide reductase
LSDTIAITGTSREEKYASLLPQLKSLAEEPDQFAALGNIISALKYAMNFFWVGLYLVKEKVESENERRSGRHDDRSVIQGKAELNSELVLGPFQGTVACTRIGFGKGVCGYAWQNKKVVIVDDVNTFEGHIACSSESKSEIVLPIFGKNKEVIMVLDVDSDRLADFSSVDELWLAKVVHIIESIVTA